MIVLFILSMLLMLSPVILLVSSAYTPIDIEPISPIAIACFVVGWNLLCCTVCYLSIQQTENFENECAQKNGHVKHLSRQNVCLSSDGRIIE